MVAFYGWLTFLIRAAIREIRSPRPERRPSRWNDSPPDADGSDWGIAAAVALLVVVVGIGSLWYVGMVFALALMSAGGIATAARTARFFFSAKTTR